MKIYLIFYLITLFVDLLKILYLHNFLVTEDERRKKIINYN